MNFKITDFLTTSYDEFVNNHNIFNGDLASQENLNSASNRLKRELNLVFSLLAVLTGNEALRWKPNIKYYPGEIVSYLTKENPSETEVRNSYYISKEYYPEIFDNLGGSLGFSDTPEVNLAMNPQTNKNHWINVKLADIFPQLARKIDFGPNNNDPWNPVNDYDVVSVKFLIDTLLKTKQDWFNELSKLYLAKNNKTPYTPSEDYNPATKKYVDDEVQEARDVFENFINEIINNYLYLDKNNKIRTPTMTTEFIKTTDKGFEPGSTRSTIGSPLNKFDKMYATDFIGVATRTQNADLAEIYETDLRFEVGTVIGLDENDYKPFDLKCGYIGVISDKPGMILNENTEGICIALKGQTPVKVLGAVKKGDYLEAAGNGFARSCGKAIPKIKVGVALESNDDSNIKLVLAKI